MTYLFASNIAVSNEVEIKNDINSPIPVSDGGGSLTVDGTLSISSLPEVEIKNDAGNPVPISDAGGSLTVDGTVAVSSLPEIEIKNDTGNPVPISDAGGSLTIDGTVAVSSLPEVEIKNDAGNPIGVILPATNHDAFGRLRVSNPFTLFDSFHRYQDNGKVNEFVSGNASSAHDSNAGSIIMTVGTASGDRIYRESSRVFAYQPGKSLLILQTFCMSPGKTGLRQRQGYFDTNNGVYIEQDGLDLYLVRRSSSTGSIVETRIPQSQWNIDPLTGSGPSSITLDITKTQILWWDIEWLGVGTVRSGFVIDGKFIQTHSFHHANIITIPYMTTACLPVRAELENTASTNSSSSYRVICTSVISEGGYELRGRPFNVSHPISTPYNLATTATLYPIMSIRLKSNRAGAIVVPKTFSISVADAGNFRYHVISGATTSGGTWVSAGTNSCVEYNSNATSYTGGTILNTAYLISTNQAAGAPSAAEFPFKYQLERNTFTNTMYEFTLAIESDAVNTDVYAHINWEEIT